jgi:hypothetical protein
MKCSKQLQVNNINSSSNNGNVITHLLEKKYLLSIMLQYKTRIFFRTKFNGLNIEQYNL